MAFKQYVRAEVAAGLDETYQFETWERDTPGRAYYDVHRSVIEEHETCVPTMRRLLSGSRLRILESGCGTGRWIDWFESLGHEAYGIDDSPGPLSVARAHAPAMCLIRADVLASPFRSASLDAVFSSYVAEHFEAGPQELLREIHRVLKPDGLLLLIVPYDSLLRRCLTNRVLELFYAYCRRSGKPLAFTEYRFTRGEVEEFLRETGFRVEHVEPDDFHPPWAKGLSLDLAPLVQPRGAARGGWELNAFGRLLARTLRAISPWIASAGIFVAARKQPPSHSASERVIQPQMNADER